jgi:hypothetical protein
MIIEISIAKEKIGKMPKGSTEALKQEMTRRVSQHYDNNGLSVLRAPDKDVAKAFVQETLQDAWENADDWFVQ